jgi:hypothetical protein
MPWSTGQWANLLEKKSATGYNKGLILNHQPMEGDKKW